MLRNWFNQNKNKDKDCCLTVVLKSNVKNSIHSLTDIVSLQLQNADTDQSLDVYYDTHLLDLETASAILADNKHSRLMPFVIQLEK